MARRPEIINADSQRLQSARRSGGDSTQSRRTTPQPVGGAGHRNSHEPSQTDIHSTHRRTTYCDNHDGSPTPPSVRIVRDEEVGFFANMNLPPGRPPDGIDPCRAAEMMENLAWETETMRRLSGTQRQERYWPGASIEVEDPVLGRVERIVPSLANGKVTTLPYVPNAWPRWLVGRVRASNFAGGADTLGSGCLVGPRHVLTASHILDTSWIAGTPIQSADWLLAPVTFSPGLHETLNFGFPKHPNGPAVHLGDAVEVVAVYAAMNFGFPSTSGFPVTSKLNWSRDYAVLVLNTRIGDTIGWTDVTGNYPPPPANKINKYNVNCLDWKGYCDPNTYQILGYPGSGTTPSADFAAKILTAEWYTKKSQGLLLGTFSDTWDGMSGGPIWLFKQGMSRPLVYGVYSFETPSKCFFGTVGNPYQGGPKTYYSGCFNYFAGGPTMSAIVNAARTEMP